MWEFLNDDLSKNKLNLAQITKTQLKHADLQN